MNWFYLYYSEWVNLFLGQTLFYIASDPLFLSKPFHMILEVLLVLLLLHIYRIPMFLFAFTLYAIQDNHVPS